MSYHVLALYSFSPIDDPLDLRRHFRERCEALEICGSLLFASEGVNGTVAGSKEAISCLLEELLCFFPNLRHQSSNSETKPFKRLILKLKSEIVTIGLTDVDPNERVGEYVLPSDWNRLIQEEDIVLIDTRNDYEVQFGSFDGAIDPKTTSFRAFPDWVAQNLDPKTHKRIAMYCTGGIRCEKASSYLLEQGFETVYHLKGGILSYLRDVPKSESLWQGDCFVFDRRISVSHGLEQGTQSHCEKCTFPMSEADLLCSNCGHKRLIAN